MVRRVRRRRAPRTAPASPAIAAARPSSLGSRWSIRRRAWDIVDERQPELRGRDEAQRARVVVSAAGRPERGLPHRLPVVVGDPSPHPAQRRHRGVLPCRRPPARDAERLVPPGRPAATPETPARRQQHTKRCRIATEPLQRQRDRARRRAGAPIRARWPAHRRRAVATRPRIDAPRRCHPVRTARLLCVPQPGHDGAGRRASASGRRLRPAERDAAPARPRAGGSVPDRGRRRRSARLRTDRRTPRPGRRSRRPGKCPRGRAPVGPPAGGDAGGRRASGRRLGGATARLGPSRWRRPRR